jgi:hypothetical protein
MTRRTHSTIDQLTAELRDAITRMVVDAEWPQDFPWEKSDIPAEQYGKAKPRYVDIVLYCMFSGSPVSLSSLGRWAKGLQVFERMRTAAGLAKQIMADVKDEHASAAQKAAAEIITAQVIDLASRDDLSAKEIKSIANAVRDCTAVAIVSDKYTREQLKAKTETAAKNVKAKLEGVGVDRKAIQEVMDEILILGKTQ